MNIAIEGNLTSIYVWCKDSLEYEVAAADNGHTDKGDAPSHWVTTECITAEVRFHYKTFIRLTMNNFSLYVEDF